MKSIVDIYVTLGLVMSIYMTLWYITALIKKRNDVADIAWGLGFLVVAWVSFFSGEKIFDQGALVTILVSIWALRLSGHIYLRNRGKKEDYRYEAWRKEWGKWFYIRTFLQVFVLQGILLLLIASPIIIGNTYRESAVLNPLNILGILIWIVGFFLEVTGDIQLSRFIQNKTNKGKLLTTGLWKYSRHPNYFGEVTQWWGIWIIILSGPFGWWGVIGPLTITFLILKVSGIPLLEEKMEKHPDFKEYKKRTSMFIPLPPRKNT
jgi:steroid 5-alpha reductase family enzyme